MAGFRMHVGTSTLLGCGYAGALSLVYGVPADTAIVSGAMCGFAGMLPDLDSDYGVPLRETMAFCAATIPMLLVKRFESLLLSHDAMVLAAVGMYLFVRFGVTKLIRKYTVHRGMFHSFPALFIFAGLAFLITGASPFAERCFKAGGVAGGCLSHLILDEIYAIEWKGGRWRFKKSFGTAMKFWGDNHWSNFAVYSKLAVVAMAILGEPTVFQQLESRNPQFAAQFNDLRNRIGALNPNVMAQGAPNAVNTVPNGWPQLATSPQPFNAPAQMNNNQPAEWQWPAPNQNYAPPQDQPQNYNNAYDTAQRPNGMPYPQ
jgi:membrane-bound metal-dependent hydrolase YbcI (DUF457 family)